LGNGHLSDVRARRGFRFHYGKHGFRHSIPKLEQVSECKTLYFNKLVFHPLPQCVAAVCTTIA
jgi:hypothetical protein